MIKNINELPNEMQMSIFTFTHDYYMLQLPPLEKHSFYKCFPIYQNKLNFKAEHIKVAPVVRIYGTNQYNQKCCCHVHGFFPFLYIKADQYEHAFKQELFLLDFIIKLQSIYQQAFRTTKPIIYKAQLQYKFDFYGYHTQKQAFLKIYLFDPLYVTKMRELLSSGVIRNKSFQCYQAHINYYMQFFSQFNIYGINEMKVCGFTFRKNYKIMPLFEKISLLQGIVHRGWQLEQLQAKRPECFNVLHKTSTCYIEIDFQYQSILNSYESKQSSDDQIHSSDEEIISNANGFRKLKVTVTKALEQIWRDQRKRRTRFKIRNSLEGVIDLTNNIQCSKEVQQGLKDPLWINFIQKGENGTQMIQMLKSYSSSSPAIPTQELLIDYELCKRYHEVVSLQRQDLVNKVQNRFQFYSERKDKIIGEIMNGERGELPDWSDDQSSNSSASDKSDDSHLSQSKSQNIISQTYNKNQGNTFKYRNNFKFELAGFKSKSLFSQCKLCRLRNIDCQCQICSNCGMEECSCNFAQSQDIQQSTVGDQESEELQLQYDVPPPSLQKVKAQRVVEYQRPFYNKIEDLYQHYKMSNNLAVQQKIAQFLQKQLKNTAIFNRQPITIKNQKKLPYFYTISQPKQSKIQPMQTLQLQYLKDPPTLHQIINFHNIKKPQKHQNRASTNKFQDTFVADLLIFNYELLVQIPQRHLYYGDPQKHQIIALVFQIYNEQSPSQSIRGTIIQEQYAKTLSSFTNLDQIFVVGDQRALLSMLINIVFRVDVDIFTCWDMEKKGVRYLLQRGIRNGINLTSCLSRSNDLEDLFQHINFIDYKAIKETYLRREYLTHGNIIETAAQKPTKDNTYYLNILQEKLKKRLTKKPILRQKYLFDMELQGRVNINLNRICQMQLKLRSYTLEAVVSHIYQTQITDFTDQYLCTSIAQTGNDVLGYVIQKIQYQKLITHELNVIGGIVQKSKIYGADFLSMMERGSQFKIESIMCRTAKQNDYLTLSATKTQVANQSMLLCRPFVMQPPKQFYCEPVLLFDFQSLYPSVMIAYNLCYSTCLGSIKEMFKPGKVKRLGVSAEMTLHLDKICEIMQSNKSQEQTIRSLSNYIFVTPNKVAFVKKTLKQGIIPKILLQFLISRIMIKNSGKLYNKQSIKKILKQRQMALKLFMNVMYGYTGATFSGRMPCSQIADSVVDVSKYCLKKSIDFLNNHPVYKGKVLYGDTDSIFFHMPTYPLKDTIQIGKKLAQEITKMFPYPMEMKFQKVYESLFLVSKKRYYGKYYQTAQSLPKYQGKGLQTVRRDGLPFTSNSMTKILNKLIDTKDLSQVKQLILSQSKRLLFGQVNINEMCMAKQVKLLKYSQKLCPAHGEAAKRLESIDPMLVPKYGERLKYLIIEGNDAIKNRAIPIFEYMLNKQKYHLDYTYYYNKLYLPPLRRTLISLINLDEWGLANQFAQKEKEHFEQHTHQTKKNQLICNKCLQEQSHDLQRKSESADLICRKCVGSQDLAFSQCVQWNCPNLYVRRQANHDWKVGEQRTKQLRLIKQILDC